MEGLRTTLGAYKSGGLTKNSENLRLLFFLLELGTGVKQRFVEGLREVLGTFAFLGWLPPVRFTHANRFCQFFAGTSLKFPATTFTPCYNSTR